MSIIFELKNVGVTYDLHANQNVNAGSMMKKFFRNHAQHEALSGITCTIEQGETLGVIGRNGAGKSTLLKVLAGVIQPTSGTIWTNPTQRIFPLLSLGVGFFPELTGRENCFLSGTILGMTKKEVQNHLDDIVEFADIGKFFDEPVKTYSSGMYARLAFSLATAVNPDVLLLDEILGVGDINFAQKCSDRIEALITRGSAAVIVSHNLDYLESHCARIVCLLNGELVSDGASKFVIQNFRGENNG